MKKYHFELIENNLPLFKEKDHIILAISLTDAIQKFVRKHDLEAPAYWDEPSFDTNLELIFKNNQGNVRYLITWS